MTGWIASTFPLRGRAASETKIEGWEHECLMVVVESWLIPE